MQTIIGLFTDRTRNLSLIAGALIGALAAGWIALYALPPEALFRSGVAPRLLRADDAGRTPQYRDVYWAHVARLYRQQLDRPQAALKEAQDLLGLTSGDLTKDEAIALTQAVQDVARKENQTDANAGRFTLDDEAALAQLKQALESAPAPGMSVSPQAQIGALVQRFGPGLILLCLIFPLILIGLLVLTGAAGTATRTAAFTPARPSPRSMPLDEEPIEMPTAVADDIIDSEPMRVPPSVAGVRPAAPARSAPAPAAQPAAPPLVETTFIAGYVHGQEDFDEDFPITTPSGELEGECGVSIADRLGVDSPAKVAALAVWVFDKADFKSVTRVLCSDYAYGNSAIRDKLSKKGDVAGIRSGDAFEIETSRMRVVVRVDDVLQNSDDPANSYITSARLSFTIQRKSSNATVSM